LRLPFADVVDPIDSPLFFHCQAGEVDSGFVKHPKTLLQQWGALFK
jgi:hypothetical protein